MYKERAAGSEDQCPISSSSSSFFDSYKERLFYSSWQSFAYHLFFTFLLLLLDGWIKWKESGSSSPSNQRERKFFFFISC
jgi:hypothetical protein